MTDELEQIIRSFADTSDGQKFLLWIFQQANLDDFSISGETNKDYYLLGRQSLANDIRSVIKKYSFESYLEILKQIQNEKY